MGCTGAASFNGDPGIPLDSTDFILSGTTLRAWAMVGTAVFRIVVSSDSMKKATATSHGNSRLLDALASMSSR